jgi:uncharacterized delta-60 repeat protein
MQREALAAWLTAIGVAAAVPLAAQSEGDLDATYGAAAAPGREIVYFDLGGGASDIAGGLALDSGGRSLLVGSIETGDATFPWAIGVARFDASGARDATFGDMPPGRGTFVLDLASSYELASESLAVEPDGSIVIAGYRSFGAVATSVSFLQRIEPDGAAAAEYGAFVLPTDSLALPPRVNGFLRDGAGRYLVYGQALLIDRAFVARLTSAFALDAGFGTAGWVELDPFVPPAVPGSSNALALELDPAGRILVAVDAVTSLGENLAAVFRLEEDGDPDPSFGTDGKTRVDGCPASPAVQEVLRDLALLPDGSVVAAGAHSCSVAGDLGWVVRMNGDGDPVDAATLLPILVPGESLQLFAVEVDPRGGLLVAGAAQEAPPGPDPAGAMHLARLEASTLDVDASFALGGRRQFDFIGLPGFTRANAAALALRLDAGRALAAGVALFGPAGSNFDFAVARLYSTWIFLDDFESSSFVRWNAAIVGG